MGSFLGQRRVKAAATLLDEREVESRRVRNRLQMVGDVSVGIYTQVCIADWNGRMLSLGEIWNCVFEGSTKVRIRGLAAVPRPPTGVNRQLLQVGEAPFLGNSSDLTRRQNRKAAQVDLFCAFRLQVVVKKPVMTDLIVGVVTDVLWHIAVEYQKASDVVWSEPAGKRQIDGREALIGCSAEFGVLNPQVGLDLFQCTEERQDCEVALRDWRHILLHAKSRRGYRQHR